MSRSPRWPARARPTPRGIAGKRVMLLFDPLVERFVPPARVSACIQRHRAGGRQPIEHPRLSERVYRSKCVHRGFEWWLVEFPAQRKMFAGSPEFFAGFFERDG